MSDQPTTFLNDVLTSCLAFFGAIGAFLAAQVWATANRISALEAKVEGLHEAVCQMHEELVALRLQINAVLHRRGDIDGTKK